MATCQNCKRTLSCGCQRKTASDGKQVCSYCIDAYQGTSKSSKNINTANTSNKPIIKTPLRQFTEEEIKTGLEKLNSWKNKFKS